MSTVGGRNSPGWWGTPDGVLPRLLARATRLACASDGPLTSGKQTSNALARDSTALRSANEREADVTVPTNAPVRVGGRHGTIQLAAAPCARLRQPPGMMSRDIGAHWSDVTSRHPRAIAGRGYFGGTPAVVHPPPAGWAQAKNPAFPNPENYKIQIRTFRGCTGHVRRCVYLRG